MHRNDARPLSPPIHLTGVWEMESIEQADGILGGQLEGFVYRRDGHPNGFALAKLLSDLHSAEEGIVTAQGMSAIAAACMSLLAPNDCVLLAQPLYGKTSFLVKSELSRWGVRWIDIDATDLNAWETAFARNPKLAIVETITNPRLSVPNIGAICRLARQNREDADRCLVLVDNTFATPSLFRPLEAGADLVMESLSKFVCGHGDAMLGFIGGRANAWGRIRSVVSAFGLASSPLDCWLTQRGLQTLEVRMERASLTAMEIAARFASHPRIRTLDYPGLPSHPNHAVARSQFNGRFGNMLTIHLHGGVASANELISNISQTIPFCPSLGDTRTTLSHPASTSHRSYSSEQLEKLGIDGGSIRLSIGLENSKLLIDSLHAGLENMNSAIEEPIRKP
ncbi:trans-sulfuration enzyme family protein [Pirellulaceae bacterium SH501]